MTWWQKLDLSQFTELDIERLIAEVERLRAAQFDETGDDRCGADYYPEPTGGRVWCQLPKGHDGAHNDGCRCGHPLARHGVLDDDNGRSCEPCGDCDCDQFDGEEATDGMET